MTSVDQWRAGGQSFEWRGHRIWFRSEGTGEPLLLVHGFPTASWDFHAVWPELVKRYRVLTLDLIGFGLSAKPRDFAYSIKRQADLVEALLAHERVERYRLLAHDMGVSIAQELLARRAPIIAVCLLNGGLFPETHRALLTQRLLASPLGPLIARLSTYRTFKGAMIRIWGERRIPEDELRSMWQLVSCEGGLAVMPQLIGYMKERKAERARWVGAIVEPAAPVRLINGVVDPVSGAHMIARYRELVANADVVELAGVGHYPQVEAPDRVLGPMLEHFTRS
ncbi:MAG: alpha/beta fold hydrolase [Myxococcota bacterium]|nr:alpha/beta fold hydrolase [Deltaproteobacteria bacterium]MDQ3337538.1 alpha/beta fold hydrolase [Myxococcota bacterium]